MSDPAFSPLPIWVQTIVTDILIPVTSVRGDIDMTTEKVVQDEVTAQLAARPPRLVLDLSQVTFMGSAGIHLVLRNHNRAHAQGSALAVVADDGHARHVLALSGVDGVLDLYRDVPAALRAVR